VPIIGGTCELQEAPQFKFWVCRALAAIARFEEEKPNWAPELPVRCEEIKNMQRGRMQLIGHYANSWCERTWWPDHPSFADYCAGLSTLPHMANVVRSSDPALFHPRPLPGLDEKTLCWTPVTEAPTQPPPVETGLVLLVRT
jgi:hypothetical protein